MRMTRKARLPQSSPFRAAREVAAMGALCSSTSSCVYAQTHAPEFRVTQSIYNWLDPWGSIAQSISSLYEILGKSMGSVHDKVL